MKKRFESILIRMKKKNGSFLLVCVFSLVLALGTLTGCSITEDENDLSSIPPETTLTENQKTDSEENEKESLSAEEQEIEDVVEAFAAVFFSGDKESVQNYLTTPFEGTIDVYEGNADTVSNTSIKGLTEAGGKDIGDTCVVSLEYKDSAESDTFQYLTIQLIKQSDGWKIQFYGIEG